MYWVQQNSTDQWLVHRQQLPPGGAAPELLFEILCHSELGVVVQLQVPPPPLPVAMREGPSCVCVPGD